MRIRSDQIRVFEDAAQPEFEHSMVAHLRDFTPLHYDSLGREGIRALIRQGKERAGRHGFTERGPVKFYIEMTVLLGIDFDTDPQYPWIQEILRNPDASTQTERADHLHGWLMDYLDSAGGPDRSFAKRALRRARELPFEPIPVAQPGFSDEVVERLHENHPEKARYLGDAPLRALVQRASDQAVRFSVASDAGVGLFVGLMFAVGHGFAGDPKYPWIANTLTNPSIASDKRVERLYSKTMTYLDHVLRSLDEG